MSMAAVALAISSGGALSSFETTVLLTVNETMDALRKAEHVQYRAPAHRGVRATVGAVGSEPAAAHPLVREDRCRGPTVRIVTDTARCRPGCRASQVSA